MSKSIAQETRDTMIRVVAQNDEILRRLDTIDRQLVPRNEYQTTVKSLYSGVETNKEDIKSLEKQVINLIWKVGGGLASIQIISGLVLWLTQKG